MFETGESLSLNKIKFCFWENHSTYKVYYIGCTSNDIQSHKLVLPNIYQHSVLHMLHDDYGHQDLAHTLDLASKGFTWVPCTEMYWNM